MSFHISYIHILSHVLISNWIFKGRGAGICNWFRRYRYKVANFIVATLQTCYGSNLLRVKLATGSNLLGVKLATYKVATLLNCYKLATVKLATEHNITKLLRLNLLPREQRYKVAT
jgi:hypothetical protein